MGRAARPVVFKLGGELLETADRLRAIAGTVARLARQVPLVVVHGGGREIDAALAQQGIAKRQIDGLRLTDAPTLQVVVAVLAGAINTRLVAAINAARGRAVGLTGADAGVAPVKAAAPHRSTAGDLVDLGLVGEPLRAASPELVELLCARGFVPVVACVSAGRDGQLYNVNADTLAGSLAARLRAARLVVAGATAGVLDEAGATIAALDRRGIDRMVRSRTATAGMIAKLRACRQARDGGVADVVIADGRTPAAMAALLAGKALRGGAFTRLR